MSFYSVLIAVSLVWGASAYCEESYTVARTGNQVTFCTVPRANLAQERCVPVEFAPNTVGSAEVIKASNGLAENPVDGKLYALLSFENTTLPRDLVEITNISIARVIVTHIANVGDSFAAIAFGCNGKLFGIVGAMGVNNATLYEVNTATGATTSKYRFTNGGNGNALAYDFDNGFLYRAGTLPSGGLGLEKINIMTWEITPYNISGISDQVGAMGYEGNNQFWILTAPSGNIAAKLYSVSSMGGNATELGTFLNANKKRKGWNCKNHTQVVNCPTSAPTMTTAGPTVMATGPTGSPSTTPAPAPTAGANILKVFSLLVVLGLGVCFM